MSYISAVSYIPTPTSSYPDIVPAAFARARRFDAIIITDDNEETLLALGYSVGGLSVHGCLADLKASMQRATEQIYDDNRGCSRSASDARWMPAWLAGAINDVVNEIVGEWLDATAPWAEFDGTMLAVYA